MRVGVVLAAVAAVGVGTVLAVGESETLHTVQRVVDGDTIIVSDAGGDEDVRVRLLNVDTPEMDERGTLAGCYAREATEFLRERLPEGTRVRLELDEETTDRYGRTLAGVVDPDSDSLINAEIARGGFGVAMLIEPNDRFHPEVLEAEGDARDHNRGMHDPALGCALPAQLAAATQALDDEAPASLPDASEAELDAHRAHVRRVRADVDRLRNHPLPAEGEDGHVVHRYHLDTGRGPLEKFDDEVSRALAELDAEEDRREREEERRLEVQREQEQRDREAAQAAEAAEASERAREREARRYQAPPAQPAPSAQPAPAPAPVPAPAPAPAPAPSGGGDNYTGCRDYGNKTAPNAVDDQGRPYTRIDCTTKLPI